MPLTTPCAALTEAWKSTESPSVAWAPLPGETSMVVVAAGAAGFIERFRAMVPLASSLPATAIWYSVPASA